MIDSSIANPAPATAYFFIIQSFRFMRDERFLSVKMDKRNGAQKSGAIANQSDCGA